jgi:RHS repeat-associated protein
MPKGIYCVKSSQAEYTYDAQGNLLRKILDGQETQFGSNILSQLISIKKGNEPNIIFAYDPFGRLLSKRVVEFNNQNKKTLSKERYFFVGYQELGTVNGRRQIQSLRVPGLKRNDLSLKSIAIEIGQKRYTPIHDLSGNVIALVDPSNQEIAESYAFTAFGQETIYHSSGKMIEKSALGNPWRFSDKRVDEETGLVFFGARYYDPEVGRWITPDPLGYADGPNLYAYVHNNPINSFDRFGFATENEPASNGDDLWKEEIVYGPRCVGISWIIGECYEWISRKPFNTETFPDPSKDKSGQPPTISYNDDFEDLYPGYERSHIYDLGLPDVANIGIGVINGMNNTKAEAEANAWYISQLSGGYNVHAVYNATHGKVCDLVESKLGLNYKATEPVRQLHQMWNNFFDQSSADAAFLMICHSQGAIHVRNALLDYPPDLRDRIIVVGIAPGGYIYKETCAQVTHYRAPGYRDFVPHLDGEGKRRSKDTTVVLNSHKDADWHDHSLKSPTFEADLRRNLDRYTSNTR